MLNLKEEECLILLLILQMGFKFLYHSATVVWFLSKVHYHGKSHLFTFFFFFLTFCPQSTVGLAIVSRGHNVDKRNIGKKRIYTVFTIER